MKLTFSLAMLVMMGLGASHAAYKMQWEGEKGESGKGPRIFRIFGRPKEILKNPDGTPKYISHYYWDRKSALFLPYQSTGPVTRKPVPATGLHIKGAWLLTNKYLNRLTTAPKFRKDPPKPYMRHFLHSLKGLATLEKYIKWRSLDRISVNPRYFPKLKELDCSMIHTGCFFPLLSKIRCFKDLKILRSQPTEEDFSQFESFQQAKQKDTLSIFNKVKILDLRSISFKSLLKIQKIFASLGMKMPELVWSYPQPTPTLSGEEYNLLERSLSESKLLDLQDKIICIGLKFSSITGKVLDLSLLSNLRKLTIEDYSDFAVPFFTLSKPSRTLKELRISQYKRSAPYTPHDLSSFLRNLENLQSVEVKWIISKTLSPEEYKKYPTVIRPDWLTGLKNLKSLELSVNTEDLQTLNILKELKRLENLRLSFLTPPNSSENIKNLVILAFFKEISRSKIQFLGLYGPNFELSLAQIGNAFSSSNHAMYFYLMLKFELSEGLHYPGLIKKDSRSFYYDTEKGRLCGLRLPGPSPEKNKMRILLQKFFPFSANKN